MNTMKFYQQSLEKLAEILTEGEKKKFLNINFFLQKHDYFKSIYNNLNEEGKN